MTENKGDLISREALKKALKSNCAPEICHDYGTNWCEACCPHNDFEDLIDNAPTVELERPQGEWLEMKRKIDNRHSVFIFKCPFCGYIEKCKANFCGKCGAEMKTRTTAD